MSFSLYVGVFFPWFLAPTKFGISLTSKSLSKSVGRFTGQSGNNLERLLSARHQQ